MTRHVTQAVCLLCCGLFFVAGCAKEAVIKPDEAQQPVPAEAPQKPAEKPVVKQAPAPPQPKEEGMKEEQVRETPAAREIQEQQETASAAPQAGAAAAPETAATSLPDSAQALGLLNLYFDFDSFLLSPQSREKLTAYAEVLKRYPELKVQIEGHSDERGSDEYNLALGEKRAKAVLDYLVSLGLSGERFSTISYGEEKPADPGHGEEAWAKNRRVEFNITK